MPKQDIAGSFKNNLNSTELKQKNKSRNNRIKHAKTNLVLNTYKDSETFGDVVENIYLTSQSKN